MTYNLLIIIRIEAQAQSPRPVRWKSASRFVQRSKKVQFRFDLNIKNMK